MVGKNDNRSISVLFSKFNSCTHGFVKCQKFANHSGRVVGMCSPIHFAAFHHQKESVRVFIQNFQRFGGHFCYGRHQIGVPVQVIRHRLLIKQCPNFIAREIHHTLFIVLKKRCSRGFQKSFHFIGNKVVSATEHHIQIVGCHLRRQNRIFTSAVIVRSTICRSSMRKFTGNNQSGRFFLFHLHCFQNGGERLIGTVRIQFHDIVGRVSHRIHGNVAGLLRNSRHVRGCGWCRVTNRCIRRKSGNRAAQIRVNIQVISFVAVRFNPTRCRNHRQ